jgi:uncharacterized protein (TIGR03083 family)
MPFAPLPPVETLHLFSGERDALLSLLRELSPEEWGAPTVCPGWNVKDVAGHLLGDDLGMLSWGRDDFDNPDFATGLDISTLPGLIVAIDRQNALWVEAMRRLSPQVVMELLAWTASPTEAYFASLDPNAIGGPIDWAGPEPAPLWLHVAREYTERWVHQQHVREAVGRPGLNERRWLGPVLEAFVRGIARVLATDSRPDGTTLRLVISGDAGGDWVAQRRQGAWVLGTDPDVAADATVTLDDRIAWRLFTKGLSMAEAKHAARIEGDAALAERVFATVSILA